MNDRRLVLVALALLLGACGPMKLESAPPTVAEDSVLRTSKVSKVEVEYATWLPSDKIAAFASLDGRPLLEKAVLDSLDKGAHFDPSGVVIKIMLAEFRLRAPGLAAVAIAGPDMIRVEVSAGARKFQEEVSVSGGFFRMSRKKRLQMLLNELIPKILARV